MLPDICGVETGELRHPKTTDADTRRPGQDSPHPHHHLEGHHQHLQPALSALHLHHSQSDVNRQNKNRAALD